MRAALSALVRENAFRARVMSVVSHEFRGALTAVLGMAQLIEMFDDREQTLEYAADIVREGERLERMISEMLDDARLQSGQVSLTLEDVDVAQLAAATAGRLVGDDRTVTDPFTRVDSDVRGIRGTGLGLSIVRRTVEMHGGRVWAESTPGQGSTFHVVLPLGGPPPSDGD